MRITLLLIVSLITLSNFSQSKEFIVVDKSTNQPIDLVQVFYPNLEIGSVTNKDGKVRIPLLKSTLSISHINYKEETFLYKEFIKKDTLYLKSNVNQLNEIVLYNINLLEKFTTILDKTYLKEYSTKKAIHNSTYKETFSVNDSLTRLFQVQLDWWSKNGMFKTNKIITKQNKIALSSIDYSKIKKVNDSIISTNGGYVENAIFFQFAHLNFLLSIIKDLGYDFEINKIDKTTSSNKVYFDAVLKRKGVIIYRHKNSLAVFNKEYTHIKYLKFNMVYESDFEKSISEKSKTPYQKKTTKHVLELAYKPLKNKKLSLSYYSSEIFGIIKTKDFTDNVSSKQSIFVNETKLSKNLKNKEINFYKPFYQNITLNKEANNVKVLLTNKEKAFLEEKD